VGGGGGGEIASPLASTDGVLQQLVHVTDLGHSLRLPGPLRVRDADNTRNGLLTGFS